ncbi:trypsin-like serine protease [uncultured Aliivibrio sp.]|uniref:trypsin-like serine protease n=1 Tax=uncultured Aliivibrio sp. TaxID=873085 RepID=UPI00262E05A0|nr:trypsin-like serine protease [uncultured Aliivibrio sp.]
MKLTNIALFMAGLSFNALAIENGTPVNWNEQNDFVKLYSADEYNSCSGTIIAGKYVLTAAHCLLDSNPIVKITSASGQKANIITPNTHSAYYDNYNGGTGNWHDVAVSELNNHIDTQQIHFFSSSMTNPIQTDDSVNVFGFGGTYEDLNYATFTITNRKPEEDSVYAAMIANGGNTTGGDSGGAWVNSNNEIVATHKGGVWTVDVNENRTRETYSTNLHYSKDFILEKVNGWHYPTLANTSNGVATIEIQSLHQGDVDLLSDLYFFGDVDVDEARGTCVTDRTISPFEVCTLEVSSNGGEGTIVLANGQEIQINKPAPTVTPPVTSGGGESGGSLGFLSIIGLLGLGFIRKK